MFPLDLEERILIDRFVGGLTLFIQPVLYYMKRGVLLVKKDGDFK